MGAGSFVRTMFVPRSYHVRAGYMAVQQPVLILLYASFATSKNAKNYIRSWYEHGTKEIRRRCLHCFTPLGVAVKNEGGIMSKNNNSRMSVLLLIHLMANRYNLVYIPLPDC